MYRQIRPAPASALPEGRRGEIVGRYCHACHSVYPRFAASHHGKPTYGRDHVAAPCVHEGEAFAEGAEWWEPAVTVMPAPSADAA